MKSNKKKKRISFLDLIGGRILKDNFSTKHTKLIFMFVILCLIFIGNILTCNLKVREIALLKKELAEKKMEAVNISVELIKYSQRSQIDERIKQQGLGLESATTPPFILHK
jgi:cell division protein FtsL